MPMYDFHCPGCEHDFEEITPSGGPAPPCPKCGAASERLMSAPVYAAGGLKEYSRKGKQHREMWKRNPPKPFK
jgi:putative FmdB family regulatory protein